MKTEFIPQNLGNRDIFFRVQRVNVRVCVYNCTFYNYTVSTIYLRVNDAIFLYLYKCPISIIHVHA